MSTDLTLVIIAIVLVVVAALLVMAETAIGRVSRGRVEELLREGVRGSALSTPASAGSLCETCSAEREGAGWMDIDEPEVSGATRSSKMDGSREDSDEEGERRGGAASGWAVPCMMSSSDELRR